MADKLFLEQVVDINLALLANQVDAVSLNQEAAINWQGTIVVDADGINQYTLAAPLAGVAKYAGSHPYTYHVVQQRLNVENAKLKNFADDDALYVDRAMRRILAADNYEIVQPIANQADFKLSWL
ncbi:two-component histidine kinase [Weissella oryzae SG25]|uniref:Two-component histidine kinase n=1 Tax=Weissella oryzae (strain DSM 25784 / JCM 18191 / LMG 30913 / SG25) TaxID=1329250 RepID=A0A069CTX4_WEIOS|nr:hypothetical protein [Weissella oryzae]GAK31245.1 two-component histidine kinase [Weissella oryzae SG25]